MPVSLHTHPTGPLFKGVPKASFLTVQPSQRQSLRGARQTKRSGACQPRATGQRSAKAAAGLLQQQMGKALALLAAGAVWISGPGNALALDKIAEFGASGLFIKDTVETLSLEDPDVKGVTVYITDFKRSLADKLAKDFFSEPSQASVTCAITGPINISDERQLRGNEGKEIFSEGRSGLQLFKNKTVRVRRVFDEKHKTLLYIAYSTRLGGGDDKNVSAGRYKTSICALPLSPEVNRATAVDQASVPASLTGGK